MLIHPCLSMFMLILYGEKCESSSQTLKLHEIVSLTFSQADNSLIETRLEHLCHHFRLKFAIFGDNITNANFMISK